MGWGDVISIGLGLGNLAVNSANASALQQMKMQQAGEAMVREFLNALRNGMFNLSQTAEEVLRSEPAAPLKAAGAMRILDYQLSSSGVTPDLFTDLADKKFAADTARLISDNSRRMYAALDANGQTQVDQVVEYVRRLPDYRYYLENTVDVDRIRAIGAPTGESASDFSMGKGCLLVIGLWLLAGVVMIVSEALAAILSMVAAVVALMVIIKFSAMRGKAMDAKKTAKEIESKIDMPRFVALESEFKTPDEAREVQQRAEQTIESFFGDYTLLQDGWRA